MGLAEAATRKVGPLPAWGWGAVVVGGYIAYRFVRGGSDGTTAAGIPVDMTAGYGGGGGSSGGGGGGGSIEDRLADAIDKLSEAVGKIPAPGSTGGGGTGGGTGGGGTATPGSGSGGVSLPDFMGGGETPQSVTAIGPSSGFFDWGDPRTVTEGYGGDTYRLAQAYAYYILHPNASRTDALFQKSDEELRFAFNQLVTGIVSSPVAPGEQAQADYGVAPGGGFATYPTIPQWALALSGVNRYTQGYIEQQYNDQGYQLALRPEVTTGTTWADLAIAIPTLQSYIYNLQQVDNPTTAQQAKLAEYRARLADYQAQYKAMVYDPISAQQGYGTASGSPPSITQAPTGTVGVPAPSTASAPVDYSAAIATLQGYIRNLQTGTVTQADRDKIATYQARITEYQGRMA